jgi:inhibitor of KinA
MKAQAPPSTDEIVFVMPPSSSEASKALPARQMLCGIALAPFGDAALVMHFRVWREHDEQDDAMPLAQHDELLLLHHAVQAAWNLVREARSVLSGMSDIVPAFETLTVLYNPLQTAYSALHAAIAQAVRASFAEELAGRFAAARSSASSLAPALAPASALVEIPVCYAPEFAPDLADIARHAELTPDEVVALHAATEYRVAMIGFTPGFPYLLGLHPRLHAPRRASPRTLVDAGSIAIGGVQTGIYPVSSPGGWNIIGRTPLRLFDLGLHRRSRGENEYLCALRVGDRVRFRAVSRDEFIALNSQH